MDRHFDFCDSEEIYPDVSLEVRSCPILFFLVLIRDIARQKFLDYRVIRCSASKFPSMSTPVTFLYLPSPSFSSKKLPRRRSHDCWIQVTYILRFFHSRNIRIARDRTWDQTVASRGKGPDFWQPYVEEGEHPPFLDLDSKKQKFIEKWLGGWFGLFIIKRGTLYIVLALRFLKMSV